METVFINWILFSIQRETVSIIWILNPIQMETVSIIWILETVSNCFQKRKRFPKELDTVSKRWKHLETFYEREGVSKWINVRVLTGGLRCV